MKSGVAVGPARTKRRPVDVAAKPNIAPKHGAMVTVVALELIRAWAARRP